MGRKAETDNNKPQTRSHRTRSKSKQPLLQTFVSIKTKKWQKDSHGLFDYEATEDQYTNDKFKVTFRKKTSTEDKSSRQTEDELHAYVYRSPKECEIHVFYKDDPERERAKRQMVGVCQIFANKTKKSLSCRIKTALQLDAASNNTFTLPTLNMQMYKDKPIMSFRGSGGDQEIKVLNPLICPFTVTKKFFKGQGNVQGYPLRPGNIIKFGRVQYVVMELKTEKEFLSLRTKHDLKDLTGQNRVYEVKQDKIVKEDKDDQSKSSGYTPTCKICLCSQETDDDKLISPCLCKGYCGVIHIGCLRQWINSKVKREHQGLVTSYNFNRFECEICKAPFPQVIKNGEKAIQMMSIQKPSKPYLIIESINPPRSTNHPNPFREQERCLHVISGNERGSLKIGRGHACEIRISDISVSRAHAQIEMHDNKFLIKDTKSKFGTLILFDEQFQLNQKHPMCLQSGRCLFEFAIEKQTVTEQNEGATESENEKEDDQNSDNANHESSNQSKSKSIAKRTRKETTKRRRKN